MLSLIISTTIMSRKFVRFIGSPSLLQRRKAWTHALYCQFGKMAGRSMNDLKRLLPCVSQIARQLMRRHCYQKLYDLPQHPDEPQQLDFFLCGWAIEILVFLPEPDAALMAFSARTVSEVYWISPTRFSISLL